MVSRPPTQTTTAQPPVDSAWSGLYREIADCPRCVLARTRTHTVPGMGPTQADIMLIGEAHGARKDEQRLPFVGPSGRFLDELLAGIGLSRESVYIAHVVKCLPPANRDPKPAEIKACAPFLDRQIAAVDPSVIVTLGRFSMARWFPGSSISRVHGKPKREGNRTIVPMYHPAAALHRDDIRTVIEADIAMLPALIAEARNGASASSPPTTSAAEERLT